MLKYFIILFLLLFVFSKPYVFYVEKRMENLKTLAKKHLKEINLLKIEWTYLNQNARLKEIASQLLPNWQAMSAQQLNFLPNCSSERAEKANKLKFKNDTEENENFKLSSNFSTNLENAKIKEDIENPEKSIEIDHEGKFKKNQKANKLINRVIKKQKRD